MREPIGNGAFHIVPPFTQEEKREMWRTGQYKNFQQPDGWWDRTEDEKIAHIDSIDGWMPRDLRP